MSTSASITNRNDIITYLAVAKLKLDADFAKLYQLLPSSSTDVCESHVQDWADEVSKSTAELNRRIGGLLKHLSGDKSPYPRCLYEPC